MRHPYRTLTAAATAAAAADAMLLNPCSLSSLPATSLLLDVSPKRLKLPVLTVHRIDPVFVDERQPLPTSCPTTVG